MCCWTPDVATRIARGQAVRCAIESGDRSYVLTCRRWRRGAASADGPNIVLPSVRTFPVVLGSKSIPTTTSLSANIHRRHLTAEQKRELIAKLLKATAGEIRTGRSRGRPRSITRRSARSRGARGTWGNSPRLDPDDTKGRQQPARKAHRRSRRHPPTSSASARREVTFDMSLNDYRLLAAWCDERDISCVEGIRHIIREALDAADRGDVGPDNAGERPCLQTQVDERLSAC